MEGRTQTLVTSNLDSLSDNRSNRYGNNEIENLNQFIYITDLSVAIALNVLKME